MKLLRLSALVSLLFAAGPLAAAETTDLDVTRVALFSSGVGYFECDATVSGDATAELKFRTDQINDIIKSMVVQDFDGGKIGIISYASQDPIEKTLRSFGVDLTGKPTLGQLLDQLRGEPVEITGALSLEGIIVGVEKTPIYNPDGKMIQEIERLTLLTDAGLQQLPLAELSGIKLADEKVAAELRKALATLARAHDADKKSVTLSFKGDGERRVRAAYLLEAPIWKTSYRLVLSDDDKPFLQGWATVENATEEDWNNVRLSLISGRPISFRMDLYTPLYVPRPLEQLELYASLRPPEYEGGFAARGEAKMARRARGKGGALPGAPPPGTVGERLRSFMTTGDEPADGESWAAPDIDLHAGVESIATAQEAGELFEYRIATPVSIPRQHSAMLPIVNQEIEAEKISIFNIRTHPKHPLNGLELKNTTGLHLMQGPVTVFDGSIYAGDAKLPDLNPAEKRLIAYALDLSTEVLIKQKPQPDELISLRIAKGVLWHRHKYMNDREYRIKNKSDKDRTVLIEQPHSEEWKLVEPKEPYERTRNLLRFKVGVPAEQTVPFPVRLERVADQHLTLSNAGLDQIRLYLRARVISPAVQEALEKVTALRVELDDVARRRVALERERDEVVRDQARIRENLKTLDKNTDAYRRQLKLFDEVDARIARLGRDIGEAREKEEQKRKALENYLLSLNVE
ncbi:MAG: hypothetical protein KAY37_13515 [Phycisphaerae bacterium]|nr:hypothetical protein [Phycisphaerae bacterium]